MRPTLKGSWDSDVMRGAESSLYWLLSKLTTATSPGTERPVLFNYETTRKAISSL